MRTLLAGAMGVAAGFCACAETAIGGFGEMPRLDADAAAVQHDAVLVAPDAPHLTKGGAGTLTAPDAAFVFGRPARLHVAAGTLALEATEIAPPPLPSAAAVLAKAAFHVDASAADTVVTGDGGAVTWLDARDAGGGTARPRAVYDAAVSKSYPQPGAYDGQTGLYFGGYGAASKSADGTGASMKWVLPDGETAFAPTAIRHLFAVHTIDKTYGVIFGSANSEVFQVGTVDSACSTRWWRRDAGDARRVCAARTYVDGAWIDPYQTDVQTGRHLLETDMLGVPGSADSFFNSRNYAHATDAGGDRTGGDWLHEVLVFTNALTETERVTVEAYLMAKWSIAAPRAAATAVTVEPGAAVATDDNEDYENGLSVTGGGAVAAAGELSVRAALAETTAIRLAADTPANVRRARAVEAAGGDTIQSVRSRVGDTLTRTTGGKADTVTKTGDGVLTLRALPAGVTNLVLQAGETRLVAPPKPRTVTGADPIVPNGSFEDGDWTADKVGFLNATARGWTAAATDSNWQNEAFFLNVTDGTTATAYKDSLYTNDIPDGCCVLALKRNASAGTTVTLPSDGVYELSFWTSGRTYAGTDPYRYFDVCLGADADSLEPVATVLTRHGVWRRHRYRLPGRKAGTVQLWFKSRDLNTDKLSLIDDVRMRFIGSADDGAVPVPNGGFERLDAPLGSPAYFRAGNTAPGWTFTQPDGAAANADAYVGLVMPQMATATVSFFDQAGTTHGDANLAFFRAGGAATTAAFTLPAGRWRLTAAVANYCLNGASQAGAATLAATLTTGGETLALGTLSVANRNRADAAWPTVITNAAAAEVTLTLAQTAAAYVTVDDLRFTRVTDGNLIVNGSFEDGETGWTPSVATGKANVGNSREILSHLTNQHRYGAEIVDGTHCLRLILDAAERQTVTFPDAGLYRLSFCAHMRWDSQQGSTTRGYNPVRAWWIDGAGVTNVIGQTEPSDNLTLACCSNFVEYAFAFRIPTAGAYDVGLQGVVDGVTVKAASRYDSEVLVDAVSLVKIDEDAVDAAADIPEEAALTVATGARLRLDFGGTNTLAAVRLGGRTATGVITAETHPAFISGPGALYVKPVFGLTLLIR